MVMRKNGANKSSDSESKDPVYPTSTDTDLRILGLRVNKLKGLVKWVADFFVAYPVIATLMLTITLTIMGFRSVGLTPVKFLGRFVKSVSTGRRWTKVCSYGIYPGQLVSTGFKKSDVEDILVDVATSDCDFYTIDGQLDDQLRSLIKHSKLDLNIK